MITGLKRTTISKKVIFLVVISNVTIACIISTFYLFNDFKKKKKEIKEKINSIEKTYLKSITTSIYEENEEQTNTILEGILGITEIIYVEVLSEFDNKVVLKKGNFVKGERIIEKTFALKYSDKLKGRNLYLGSIRVVSSLNETTTKIQEQIFLFVFIQILQVLIFSILIFYIFKLLIVKHLEKICIYTTQLDLNNDNSGDLALDRKKMEKVDELEMLVLSFNKMKENLKVANKKIMNYNFDLELEKLQVEEEIRISEIMYEDLKKLNIEIEMRAKKEVDLKSEIINKNENLTDSYNEISILNLELKGFNKNLESKIEEATNDLKRTLNETNGMLKNINKAIFCVSPSGEVLSPVSNHSEVLFRKKIVGQNGLKLLFFHLKDGSEEKAKLINAFKNIFGVTESKFFNLKMGLPNQVIQPDKEQKKGRVLNIQYVPISNQGKVEKLMLIVEDVTDISHNFKVNQVAAERYNVLKKLLSFKDQKLISIEISDSITQTIQIFDNLIKYEVGSSDISVSLNLVKKFLNGLALKKLSSIEKVNKLTEEMIWGIESLEEYKSIDERIIIQTITEDLSSLLSTLILHADVLNELGENRVGPGIQYDLSKDFKNFVKEREGDLKRAMVNILEYVFLVRKVDDLDEDKVLNAPKKARLYEQFDEIISLIMNRSRLLSFSLKVLGENELSKNYLELSELLRQMPSKDKLTKEALVNNLIEPYKKTLIHD
ncbi:MICOS complex subunit MIC60 [Bacteriovoracales bacterium]|nr:MICOS complex subunit MIC60 [Bacteriovoracales bacterium]